MLPSEGSKLGQLLAMAAVTAQLRHQPSFNCCSELTAAVSWVERLVGCFQQTHTQWHGLRVHNNVHGVPCLRLQRSGTAFAQ